MYIETYQLGHYKIEVQHPYTSPFLHYTTWLIWDTRNREKSGDWLVTKLNFYTLARGLYWGKRQSTYLATYYIGCFSFTVDKES